MDLAIPVLATAIGAVIAWSGAILAARQRRLGQVDERAKAAAATALVQRMSEGLEATHGVGPAEVAVRPVEKQLWKLPDELEVTPHDSPTPSSA
ncbi:hypothetical protein [Streptomyces sp. NPDC091259]|uniref:hypothetical protein n=1 Tax=Streptomyces sp. NPDC091259 TaxID=3365976 RepID=UPI00380A823A